MSSIGGVIGGAIGGAAGAAIDGLLCQPSGIQQVISVAKAQQSAADGIKDACQQTVAAVNGSWIGGDEEAYSKAILTQLLPAIASLALAFANVQTNLSSGLDVMQNADQAISKLGDQLGSQFNGII
jgi:uncharacterized protein YukE